MEESSEFAPPLRVGITCNLEKNITSVAADEEAENDAIETVSVIKNALDDDGWPYLIGTFPLPGLSPRCSGFLTIVKIQWNGLCFFRAQRTPQRA
jgi:hypothetical protein